MSKMPKLQFDYEEHIVPLLKNAGWTKKQIRDITPEQFEQVVAALDKFMVKRQDEMQAEYDKVVKESQKKYAACIKILQDCNIAAQKIDEKINWIENEEELIELINELKFVDYIRYQRIKEIMGEEDFNRMMGMEI